MTSNGHGRDPHHKRQPLVGSQRTRPGQVTPKGHRCITQKDATAQGDIRIAPETPKYVKRRLTAGALAVVATLGVLTVLDMTVLKTPTSSNEDAHYVKDANTARNALLVLGGGTPLFDRPGGPNGEAREEPNDHVQDGSEMVATRPLQDKAGYPGWATFRLQGSNKFVWAQTGSPTSRSYDVIPDGIGLEQDIGVTMNAAGTIAVKGSFASPSINGVQGLGHDMDTVHNVTGFMQASFNRQVASAVIEPAGTFNAQAGINIP